ncbi:MAG TPA: hypothetical protein VFD77_00330 [Brumimicrobium sp.]|nr:hypothetical protein [Brumimicrobium sp.]
MKQVMRKVKTILMATMVIGLTAGLTACGQTEETTEEVKTEETTTDEHPAAESDEHPSN